MIALSRVYRAALYLYPPAFRREFGGEMTRDFDEASIEAWVDGRWPGLFVLWSHVGVDLIQTVLAEWLRHGRPALAILPGLLVYGGCIVLAQLLPSTPLRTPPAPDDRDLVLLLMLAMAVLLIVGATLVFSVWCTRPRTARRRV